MLRLAILGALGYLGCRYLGSNQSRSAAGVKRPSLVVP